MKQKLIQILLKQLQATPAPVEAELDPLPRKGQTALYIMGKFEKWV
jgi:hypothetical protein